MQENIGRLAQKIHSFTLEETGKQVHALFEANQDLEGVVVLDNDKPAGIIMRTDFYQKLGKQFGFSLYMNRPVSIVMKKDFLLVDAATEISDISMRAMNRNNDSLYDFIVVEENEKYLGVVSIKQFLLDLAKKREEQIILLKSINERERAHREAIEEMHSSIRNLMDNAGQGFLSIDGNFAVSEQYSRECISIFGCEIGGTNFIDLISPYLNDDQRNTVPSILKEVFGGPEGAKVNVFLTLMPKELKIREKIIKLEYKVIENTGNKSLMLILTDITEKKELEQKMAEERNHLKLIVKAVSNQDDVISAIQRLREFFAKDAVFLLKSGQTKAMIVAELFRSVHTFKGDLSHLYLMNASSNLHKLEDSISAMSSRIDEISLKDLETFVSEVDVEGIIEKDVKVINDILGEDYFNECEHFLIPLDVILTLEQLASNILSKEDHDKLIPEIRKLRCHNIKEILRGFDDSIQNIALRLEKAVQSLAVKGDDVFIDKQKYQSFIKSLMHIFRNSIDHGIETPEQRVEIGKSETGKIDCEIKMGNDNSLTIIIRDDGRGIDYERIKKKAVEKGIYTSDSVRNLSSEQVADIIFLDEFSTKDSISIVSGRGVGLSAVRSEVERLGGIIKVKTEPGNGTEFIISIPLIY
ncbi:MAG: ATP-binding protein [Clostridia bacterium]|nr:ATP-binding protein [Clostridia bacterium]